MDGIRGGTLGLLEHALTGSSRESHVVKRRQKGSL